MKVIQAAILSQTNKPLEVSNIQAMPLLKGQVYVKILYSGICGSQLMEISGDRGQDPWLPHLLGHEGSGIVVAIGEGVSKVKPGDEVILSWIKGDGLDAPGAQYMRGNQVINSGRVTTLSNYSIVSESRVVKKPADLSFDESILFGCAIPTGAGIVLNQVKPKPSNTLLIIGLGGIGLSALIMSVALKVKKIVVIDTHDSKLEHAKNLGAHFAYNAKNINLVKEVLTDTEKGFDYCIESAGLTKTIELGFDLLNKDYGQLFFASHPPHNEKISILPHELISGKKIFGSWGGDVKPNIDLPKIWNILKKTDINLKDFMPIEYSLDDINLAIDDLKKGKVFRPLVKMKH
tara:strand:+ start:194 stop:1234 length:1041 start_codon:yes stop_codon:yes gene_type:complete